MTYTQRFRLPDGLLSAAIEVQGVADFNPAINLAQVTVEKYSEYRRAWRAAQKAWAKFEPSLELSALAGRGVRVGPALDDEGNLVFKESTRGLLFNGDVNYAIPFSALQEGLTKMLPKGVKISVTGRTLYLSGVGIAEKALAKLGYNGSPDSALFYLTPSWDVAAWELRTLLGYIRSISAEWRGTLRSIIRQNREVKPEHLSRHDRAMLAVKKDTGKSLNDFLEKRRRDLVTDDRVIATLPIAEHGTLSSRRWGIEIELAGARGVGAPLGWEKKDDGSLRSAYTTQRDYIDPEDCPENDHRYRIEATTESGAVIDVENPDYVEEDYCEYCGYPDEDEEGNNWEDTAEIVSPILRSFHSRGLEKLLDDARNEPQNDTAGTHVHVEANDLTPKQLGALVYAYEFIEPIIQASYAREDRHYCANYGYEELRQLNRVIKTGEGGRGYGEGDRLSMGRRYKTVNLMALDTHGTVEFRAMGPAGGSIDYEYLIRWAHFCREMVNVAKANVPMSTWSAVKTFDDVKAIFVKYGQETSDLTLAALDFNPETDYAAIDPYIATTEPGLSWETDSARELIEV